MAIQKLLDLPPIPAELKSIVPFLQRAEELRKPEPIIAYWCAYYAAQVGIGLKARNTASRDVLFSLLGVLEHMKKEIGGVDAIEIESASAAFVENFALKVFQSADNEDRRGASTRLTAKKFLAASNFLEVLNTFPKADVSESNEDKIRYAKWKAADIAKALREGRKPAPGPAGQELDPLQTDDHSSSLEQTTASPPVDQVEHPHRPSTHLSSSPAVSHDISYGSPPKNVKVHRRDGSGSSTNSGDGASLPRSKKVWVSGEVEGKISPPSSPPRSGAMKAQAREGSPDGKKHVHFSSSADVLPSTSELLPRVPSPTEVYQGSRSIYASPMEKRSPSPPSMPQVHGSPSASYSPPRMNIYASPSQFTDNYSSSPPRSYPVTIPPPPPPVPAANTSSHVELTPQLITEAQKHCRFAISSLDYEDAEQAKKELWTALALLGGI